MKNVRKFVGFLTGAGFILTQVVPLGWAAEPVSASGLKAPTPVITLEQANAKAQKQAAPLFPGTPKEGPLSPPSWNTEKPRIVHKPLIPKPADPNGLGKLTGVIDTLPSIEPTSVGPFRKHFLKKHRDFTKDPGAVHEPLTPPLANDLPSKEIVSGNNTGKEGTVQVIHEPVVKPHSPQHEVGIPGDPRPLPVIDRPKNKKGYNVYDDQGRLIERHKRNGRVILFVYGEDYVTRIAINKKGNPVRAVRKYEDGRRVKYVDLRIDGPGSYCTKELCVDSLAPILNPGEEVIGQYSFYLGPAPYFIVGRSKENKKDKEVLSPPMLIRWEEGGKPVANTLESLPLPPFYEDGISGEPRVIPTGSYSPS